MAEIKDRDALASGIRDAYTAMMEIFQQFSKAEINTVPYADSWTAAQVVEHILKGTSRLPDSKTKAVDRQFDEHAAKLEEMFLDFDKKMKSPSFLEPGKGPFDQEEMLKRLGNARQLHLQTIANDDLTLLCLDFEMPGIGYLTRYEFLRFYVVHIKRHTHQLQKIYNALHS